MSENANKIYGKSKNFWKKVNVASYIFFLQLIGFNAIITTNIIIIKFKKRKTFVLWSSFTPHPNLVNPINLQFLLLSVNWRGTFGSKYVEVWASSFYMWVFTYVRLCGRMSEIEIWEHISLSSVPIGCRLGSNISVFLPFCMILILEDKIFRMKITFHRQVCQPRILETPLPPFEVSDYITRDCQSTHTFIIVILSSSLYFVL